MAARPSGSGAWRVGGGPPGGPFRERRLPAPGRRRRRRSGGDGLGSPGGLGRRRVSGPAARRGAGRRRPLARGRRQGRGHRRPTSGCAARPPTGAGTAASTRRRTFSRKPSTGLTEWRRSAVAGARLVANPGCYPTASALALKPLFREFGDQVAGAVVIDAKSGVSGAGRNARDGYQYSELNENLKPLRLGRSSPSARDRAGAGRRRRGAPGSSSPPSRADELAASSSPATCR